MANTRETMGEQACLDALVADTLTTYEDDGVTKVKGLVRHSALQSVTLPNVTSLDPNAFQYDVSLESVTLGSVSTLGSQCFAECVNLKSLDVGSPTRIEQYALQNCRSLSKEELDLTAVTAVADFAFNGSGIGEIVLPLCTSLGTHTGRGTRASVVDLGKSVTPGTNKFNGANALCHLVLRGVTSVVTLTANALTGTGIAAGVGWIYVPTELVDSYKAASVWSNYASQIVSIDEYPKALQDETISDSWATIAASNSYATDYPVGSIKYVNVGGTRLAMQLVATDADDLASGGKARMTWVSRDLLTSIPMNTAAETTGGWASCELRSFLRTVIYPQIEQDARTAIKEVTKTYHEYMNDTQSVTDTVWIPSAREVSGGTNYETSGCDYTTFFTNDSSHVKKQGIGGSTTGWWLRSASSATDFRSVSNNGSVSYTNASYDSRIALGFCI